MTDSIPNPIEAVARRINEAKARYKAAMHAMQTGVAFDEAHGDDSLSPKHLRVGVNSCLVDSGALAGLLITKRVITEVEYVEALADAAEAEQKRYTDHVNAACVGEGKVRLV